MNDLEIVQAFSPLYDDVKEADQFYVKKPLLAHYTSLSTLEKILETDEIWFSNPLFMNDLEEVRFWGMARCRPCPRESGNQWRLPVRFQSPTLHTVLCSLLPDLRERARI